MTIRHITHHLSCRECQDALRQDPPDPPAPGQCALGLDDRDPPARCPHPRSADTDWCEIHAEAILEAAARTANEALAALVTEHDRGIARMRGLLRQVDEAIRQGEEAGLTDVEMLPHRLTRERMASHLNGMLASNQAAETWLDSGTQPPAD